MLISRKLLTILALGSLQTVSAQSAVLTRTRAKLPSVATLKKAITWKRAGIGACVLAFLAYKKYVKTDDEVYSDYRTLWRPEYHLGAAAKGKPLDRITYKRLRWFGRPKNALLFVSRSENMTWQEHQKIYRISTDHRINRGWLIDTHIFTPRVTETPIEPIDLAHFGKDHSGSEEPSAEVKKRAADADEVPEESPRVEIQNKRAEFFRKYCSINECLVAPYASEYGYKRGIEAIVGRNSKRLWCGGDKKTRIEKVLHEIHSQPGSHDFTLVYLKGGVSGFITLKGNHIYLLAVAKNSRRGGVASRMLCAAIDYLLHVHEGDQKITIDVQPDNAAALKLYRNCGFEFSGEQGAVPGLIRGRLNIKAYQDFRKTVFPS